MTTSNAFTSASVRGGNRCDLWPRPHNPLQANSPTALHMLVAGLVSGLRGSFALGQFILFRGNAPARTPVLPEAEFLDQPTQSMKMKSLIGMEMLLLGASILIFRSVWNFLDTLAWASGTVGLAVLLVVGLVAAVVALRRIEALPDKAESKTKVE